MSCPPGDCRGGTSSQVIPGMQPGFARLGRPRTAFPAYAVAMHARGEGARAVRNRFYGILVRPGRVLTMSL